MHPTTGGGALTPLTHVSGHASNSGRFQLSRSLGTASAPLGKVNNKLTSSISEKVDYESQDEDNDHDDLTVATKSIDTDNPIFYSHLDDSTESEEVENNGTEKTNLVDSFASTASNEGMRISMTPRLNYAGNSSASSSK